jgi:hypothetical protein
MCLGDGRALPSQLLLVWWSTCAASPRIDCSVRQSAAVIVRAMQLVADLRQVATGTPVKKLAASCSGCDRASVGKGRPH